MNNQRFILSGVLIGTGLGGLINNIVLQQVLGFHQMFSATLTSNTATAIRTNIYWSGIVDIILVSLITIGVILFWREGKDGREYWPGQILFAALLTGWGIFNLVEGGIAHHVLGIHHVYEPMGLSEYDYLYFASGPFFMLAGYFLIALNKRRSRGYYSNYWRPYHHKEHKEEQSAVAN